MPRRRKISQIRRRLVRPVFASNEQNLGVPRYHHSNVIHVRVGSCCTSASLVKFVRRTFDTAKFGKFGNVVVMRQIRELYHPRIPGWQATLCSQPSCRLWIRIVAACIPEHTVSYKVHIVAAEGGRHSTAWQETNPPRAPAGEIDSKTSHVPEVLAHAAASSLPRCAAETSTRHALQQLRA